MKKKIKYAAEPLEMDIIADFLPPPDDLVKKEDTVKVTIGLSKPTVDFFKARAKRNSTQYQKMIRRLLDLYASKYQR
jgi:predicted DNA binding CopG/RHH family protein